MKENTIRLSESDLVRLVKRIVNEQSVPPGPQTTSNPTPRTTSNPTPQTTSGPPIPRKVKNPIHTSENSPYYCRIGQSQGRIGQVPIHRSGPNISMGETGFGLYDSSNKLICTISTKYPQGGYVARPTR